jgi:7,8-dihydropterin-6-yl-methyl-4-(beta-D-ribofuranosyl)aminobenzene 5'-phosphate synthase
MSLNLINEVDKITIQTLQDNYIDISALDNNAIVTRGALQLKTSILAEHGFSAIVKTMKGDMMRSMLFDFGFSEGGAAMNALTLGIDMQSVEAAVLSHGHVDHFGGMEKLSALIGKKDIPLVVHPAAFRTHRFVKFRDTCIDFPEFTREKARAAGFTIIETITPYSLLEGDVLFLGEIPRTNDFEKGFPLAFYKENGYEKPDPTEDDTSIVMNLKGKGLVIISGCAHSGIINTIHHAIEVTGISQVYLIMGGFHLSGPLFEPLINRTTEELKKFNPAFVIPTHCTGRKAIANIEKVMPAQFILNMSGTALNIQS